MLKIIEICHRMLLRDVGISGPENGWRKVVAFFVMVEVAGKNVSLSLATHVYLCYMLSTLISEVGEGYGTKRTSYAFGCGSLWVVYD